MNDILITFENTDLIDSEQEDIADEIARLFDAGALFAEEETIH